ncbi:MULTISPECIES: hypothetical protein [unclassified Wolbachia]|uniref:hypothetical protein n=1 Tax=unclassified Wolbachia TaxID=2640676 RepID=UPI002231BF68|nr:hypothetical protein [Wolbachia endosymbiont (group A) of Apoderus coryli]
MTASLTIVIPLRVSGIYAQRYRDSMTVRGSMTITSSSRYLLAAKRYRDGMT